MKTDQELGLRRSSSCSTIRSNRNRKIIPAGSNFNNNHSRSSSTVPDLAEFSDAGNNLSNQFLLRQKSDHHLDEIASFKKISGSHHPPATGKLSGLLHSLLKILSLPTHIPTCKWLSIPTHLSVSPSLGRKVTGTLFGHRRGHVSFAVQLDPRSDPVLLLELATSTSSLVKEMSSGLVRIALESEKSSGQRRLFQEPRWAMYCNGRKCGYATSRACGEFDWHVLNTVQSVSVGAGVIPMIDDGKRGGGSEGELLYMRARFERVVGSRDSEAFYMMNPDGNGGPDLSIFLLRI